MATLPTRSFTTIVQTIAAGIQGRASALIDFSPGSPLRAIAESFAGAALWIQALILQVLNVTRLATSSGADVDSFVNDFGVTRIAGGTATGQAVFARLTAAATTPFIPVGAGIQTLDGTQSFTVIADTTNLNYNAGANGYYIPAGQSSVSATVQANVGGVGGNIAIGALGVLTTPITGVDTVSNTAAFTGGAVGETDAALKVRFVLFILGLAQGNVYGIEYALAALNVTIAYQIVDQKTYAGASQGAFFYVVVDDGSGSPPTVFLTACSNAVNARRALGVNFSVFAPSLLSANVNVLITSMTGYVHANVVAAVSATISANITALGLGAGLDIYQLAAWALAVPGVAPGGISGLTLNSLTGDAATIAANPQVRIMPGTITVS